MNLIENEIQQEIKKIEETFNYYYNKEEDSFPIEEYYFLRRTIFKTIKKIEKAPFKNGKFIKRFIYKTKLQKIFIKMELATPIKREDL